MSMRKAGAGGLVYSTERGRMCPACRRALALCICKVRNTAGGGSADGIVRVGRESKGRGGKTVTLVRGVALDAAGLSDLGKRLRSACGAGGTVKDGVLEVQGDHAERVTELLRAEGFVVKRSGG
jgi:translation initiation factor 1